MASLTITSGLTGFRLLQGISRVSEQEIVGQAVFDKAPLYAGLEAMAQLGALDVRRRVAFSAHAFLLKVARCNWPGVPVLDGLFQVRAYSGSRSLRAFSYRTRAIGPSGQDLEAELLFGVTEYDTAFQKRHLQHYYQDLFTCLCNATSAS